MIKFKRTLQETEEVDFNQSKYKEYYKNYVIIHNDDYYDDTAYCNSNDKEIGSYDVYSVDGKLIETFWTPEEAKEYINTINNDYQDYDVNNKDDYFDKFEIN